MGSKKPRKRKPKESHLSIFLIGCGYGESIVLKWGNDRFGVVDCYSHRTGESDFPKISNPTISLLKKLNASQLEFLAVTHPHEDHVRGLVDLMKNFGDGRKIKQYILFPSFDSASLYNLNLGIAKLRLRTSFEQLFDEPAGTSANEFNKFCRMLRNLGHGIDDKIRRCNSIDDVELGDGLKLKSLGPGEKFQNRYGRHLNESLENLSSKGIKSIDHNMICPIFLFSFGKSGILLGADRERGPWKDCLDNLKKFVKGLKVKFVKVSHHGSSNGYCEGLYGCLTPKFIAGLTPFDRTSNPLPQRVGLLALMDYAKTVHVTNAAMAEKTKLPFKSNSEIHDSDVLPSLRETELLVTTMRKHPDWSPFFDPPNKEESSEILPLELIDFLRKNPELLPFVKVGVEPSQSFLDHFGAATSRCVSFTFDLSGNEVITQRHLGRETAEWDCHRDKL